MDIWQILNTPISQLLPFNKIRAAKSDRISPIQNKRRYDGALVNRLTADWIASSTSADSELLGNLRLLRNRSRDLVRNNDYARGAVRTITNNVVGKGISLQSQVKKRRGGGLMDEPTNAQVEAVWTNWNKQKYCHTAGLLCFQDIERLLVRSLIESGEILIRFITRSFDGSPVPLALEIIEADQLIDDYSSGNASVDSGHQIRMGVEIDEWKRPVAYWLYNNHPGDYQSRSSKEDRILRVPADKILHLYICDRPGQTRGIPWFHSTLQRLRNVGGYEEAELIAARAQAAVMGFIETPDPASSLTDEQTPSQNLRSLEPGAIELLAPGEKFSGFAPTRPGAGFDPFIKLMLRGVATGLGMSYEALTRDLSQVNYSSARIGMLEDRDYWRILQNWLIRNFHQPVFERWLDLAVLSGALDLPGYELNPTMYCCPRWVPRGWTWVDPAKEIDASVSAIRSGLSTLTQELGETGLDIEDVLNERRRELDLAASLNLVLDTDPAAGGTENKSNLNTK